MGHSRIDTSLYTSQIKVKGCNSVSLSRLDVSQTRSHANSLPHQVAGFVIPMYIISLLLICFYSFNLSLLSMCRDFHFDDIDFRSADSNLGACLWMLCCKQTNKLIPKGVYHRTPCSDRSIGRRSLLSDVTMWLLLCFTWLQVVDRA